MESSSGEIPQTAIKYFWFKMKIVRIMTASRHKTSCKTLFQSVGILTITSQYILSLMKFLLNKKKPGKVYIQYWVS